MMRIASILVLVATIGLFGLGTMGQAQDYIVVDEHDHSFGNVRYRITLEIEAPWAQTDRERLQAMMTAAVDRHRKDRPDAVSVRLWDSYETDFAARNGIDYAPDGCGWTGDRCTGELWTDLLNGTIPRDLADFGKPTRSERGASEDLACRRDLECWGKEQMADAILACEPLIEGMARYDFRWTRGFFRPMFERWQWDNIQEGSLSYTGNQVRFMNAFGAWLRITYWCHYNPGTGGARVQVFE